MKIGLMAMVRNEQRLVAEFMAHHIGLGIERLHLLDNESTDATRAIIEQAARAYPGITVETWSGSQVAGFERGLEVLRGEVEWLFACDCDEFIVSGSGEDLIAYLHLMDAHAAIGLHWALFGSSGLIADPFDLYTATFLRRAADDAGPNHHIKSLVRPRFVQGVFNPHAFALDPQHFPYVNCRAERLRWAGRVGLAANAPILSPFRVNHYFCRNRDAWAAKQANALNGVKGGFMFARTEEDWLLHDQNEVGDLTALRYVPRTREILARMGFLQVCGDPDLVGGSYRPEQAMSGPEE